MGFRDSVAVVVVTRRHPDRLADTLKAVSRQDGTPSVIVVNLTGEAVSTPAKVVTLELPTESSLGDAVSRAVQGRTEDLVWILRDDTQPRLGALSALAAVFDTSPSAGIVGPKQLDADVPIEIREMGESMSRSGFAIQLAEREMDQGQYDRTSDVLGVGEAGMLVRREVWESLNGFDSALGIVDGALDFCYRARTAGWRVEIVPSAVIETKDSSLEAVLGEVSESKVVREEARARAHRVLSYLPALAAPFRTIALIVGAFGRGIGRFVQKRPSPFAELAGTVAGVARLGAIAASRRSVSASTVQPIDRKRLFVTRVEIARRRAMERDERRAAAEALDSEPRLPFGQVAGWLTVAAGLVGLVLGNQYFGAAALNGGGLVPLPGTWSRLIESVGAVWTPAAGGMTTIPDGFVVLLAGLGSLTWWDPNATLVALWMLAIPLSFLFAWIGAGAFTVRTGTAVIIAAGWTLFPTLHIALAEGRAGAVLAHLAIPLALRALMGRGIVSAGWFAILAAVIWVSVPALSLVLVGAVVIRAVTGRIGILLALIPALALELPRILFALSTNGVLYFADRGVPFAALAEPTTPLQLWPTIPELPFLDANTSSIVVWSFVAVSVVATILATVRGSTAIALTLAVGTLGALTLSIIGNLPLSHIDGHAVHLFAGSLLDPLWFALLGGLAVTATSLKFVRGLTAPIALVILVAVSSVSIAAPLLGKSVVAGSTVRTLPAYVEAETVTKPGGGTLIITPNESTITAELQRNSGVTLTDWTATVATRRNVGKNEKDIATLAGNLIVESGFDVTSAAEKLGVVFVLLKASPTNPTVSAISSHPGLTRVGVTDRGILWVVDGVEPTHAGSTSRDVVYLAVLAAVLIITLIAAVPTSLPRRRRVDDDLAVQPGEEDA